MPSARPLSRLLRPMAFMGILWAGVAAPAAAQPLTTSLTRPDAVFAEPFTALRGVREMADGRVMVADLRDKLVQIVDLRTGAVAAVGREGQGPGEWSLPMGLYAMPNGQTVLQDMGNMRFLLIGADGKPIRAISPPNPPAQASAQGGGVRLMGSTLLNVRGADAQGRLYFQAMALPGEGSGPDSVAILRWDLKDRVDTVGWVPVATENRPQITRTGNNMTFRMGTQRAWPAETQWAVAPNGQIAMAQPAPYRLVWRSPSGASPGPIVPVSPVRVTEADKEEYREAMARATPVMVTMGGGGMGGNRAGASVAPRGATPSEDPEWPETKPPFTGRDAVLMTPEGEAWVQRTVAAGAAPTYDVFDGRGQRVRQVTLRPRSRVIGFGKETVYVVRIDQDDLQYLERYRR